MLNFGSLVAYFAARVSPIFACSVFCTFCAYSDNNSPQIKHTAGMQVEQDCGFVFRRKTKPKAPTETRVIKIETTERNDDGKRQSALAKIQQQQQKQKRRETVGRTQVIIHSKTPKSTKLLERCKLHIQDLLPPAALNALQNVYLVTPKQKARQVDLVVKIPSFDCSYSDKTLDVLTQRECRRTSMASRGARLSAMVSMASCTYIVYALPHLSRSVSQFFASLFFSLTTQRCRIHLSRLKTMSCTSIQAVHRPCEYASCSTGAAESLLTDCASNRKCHHNASTLS